MRYVLVIAALMLVLLAACVRESTGVTLPMCTEDEPYLHGRGNFNGATWERYECVHIDEVTK